MKKNLLMIVAICLLALPTQANNLAEQLCEDETFVAFVKESEEMGEYLRSLDMDDRAAFLQSSEMSCFLETMAGKLFYTHQVLTGFEGDRALVITDAIKQVAVKHKIALTKSCESQYSQASSFCYLVFEMEVGPPGSPYNPYAYQHLQECLAAAALQYAICSGGVS